MKKVLIIIGVILVVIIAAAAIIPIVFKDKIKAKLDEEIAKSVNAEVNFATEDFSLSVFRNFPNVTAILENFSVVGKDEFAGDTLIAAASFRVVLNLKSVLFDDKMTINRIEVANPNILVKVLENGKANYDIMIGEEDEPLEETDESTEFSLGIDSWEITNGKLVYDDRSLKFYTALENFNHKGAGDFSQDIFDLDTHTDVESLSLSYEDMAYLKDKKVVLDMVLNMNLPEMKFTFKDNTARINDFGFGFDGSFAMPTDDYVMDVAFASKENTFKSLLSLIPGFYKEGFEDVQTEGNLKFDGFVKGIYSEVKEQIPAFQLNLLVDDAMFKYPDLPTAVDNINIDMMVDNKDGNLDNTVIDVRNFTMNMGKNPVNGKIRIEGLDKYKIAADIQAKLDLAELSSMYPIEGTALRGIYNLDLKANGVYDSISNSIPKIQANMGLRNGYIKSSEFPSAIENFNFVSSVLNQSGKMADTEINVSDFNMLLDGEKMSGRLFVKNFNDYTWDVALKGNIDLEKLTKIYPLENMVLAGKLYADIETKGKMSDLDAERYDQMPTSGTMSVENFSYKSSDVPQGFNIATAKVAFDPAKVTINQFSGNSGRTDINLDGYVSNYINYIVKDNQTIRGKMNFKSKLVDLNELMGGETTEDTTASEPLEVIEIPKNVDFELVSAIGKVEYSNLTLNNVKGIIVIRDGVVAMDKLDFNTLGGQFGLTGNYNTQEITKPTFDFDMVIQNLSIKDAYQSFNTVQALAPIAQNVTGNFSTDFKIGGVLGKDMMPVLSTLTGGGLIKIAQAALVDSKIISGLTQVTKLSNTDQVALKDVVMQTELKEGRLFVKPFNINLGNYKTVVSGSNGIDGSLDYDLQMNVPAGALGSNINNALASVTGNKNSSSEIKLNLNLGGTYNSPKIGLAGANAGEGAIAKQAEEAVKERATEEIDKVKDDLEEKRKEAEEKARLEIEKQKQEAEEKAREELEKQKNKATDKAKDKLKDIFKKPATKIDTTKTK